MTKISIYDEEALTALLKENNYPSFRVGQIYNAFFKNFITDFQQMETLPKDLRTLLSEKVEAFTLHIDNQVTSKNGQTTKTLYVTEDGQLIESVIMRHLSGRNTLCISSQAGCPMGCTFCATGKLGLQKNLTLTEVLEQVMRAAKILNDEGGRLRNVVFMGMGEPFLNYPVVKQSIEVLSDQKKFDLSSRRITVSTCGIVPGIQKFTQDFNQTSLAISLHAPNDEVRKSIMPVDHTYDLKSLMKSLDEYVEKTNRRIFYEYIMIKGVNDSIFLADELGKLLEGKLAHVNFIPYNPGEGTGGTYEATPKFIIEKFQRILEKYGIPSTIRATMGDDIDAACGQLARKKVDSKK